MRMRVAFRPWRSGPAIPKGKLVTTAGVERASGEAELSFSRLLKLPVLDANDQRLGVLEDAVARLRDNDYPIISGFVLGVGGRLVFVNSTDTAISDDAVRVTTASPNLQTYEPAGGELRLRADVLQHRLIDLVRSRLVKAYDVRLRHTERGWVAAGLDAHRHGWFSLGAHADHPAFDWRDFVLLVGREKDSRAARSRWVWRLKPAQIADLIESASTAEQSVMLAEVHADPALEASVFEELDDNKQAQLLRSRSDQEVAGVVSRMRADDAADAIMELPQDRRQTVLNLLPEPQNRKVLTLLGYHPTTAGGLMGIDFIALPEDRSVADALAMIRAAQTHQPEALTTIHSLAADGALAGTLSLVRALQLDPDTPLRDAAERGAIFATPHDDIVAITTRMADFNLLSLPVLDASGRMLGIITVDDALEAAIPRDWSRRQTGQPAPHLEAPPL